ncbi:MAG: adenosylcobinamide-GDP ribazoletransferase [Acidimicrobiales bacterium]
MREALAFLTALGGARVPGPRALRWFPVVGAVLGAALGGIWWVAGRAWPAPVAAAVVVVADLGLTGMLHIDGLADAADGLLPHLSAGRRLEVMAGAEVGAFGVATVGATLLLRFAALTVLRPAPLLLVGLWCASRTSMAATVDRLPYARTGGGLVSAFGGGRVPWTLLAVAGAAGLGAGAAWSLPAGPVAVAVAFAGFGAVLLLARRRVGGYTGDVLGAAGVVGETLGLLTAAARW